MDYEKKYKEALERARIWQNHLYDTNDKDYANELNYIFPELAESGDEKIRKQILSFLKKFEYDHYRNLDFSAWIAWLEKQGDKDSQVKLPTFTFDDILALQCCMETVKKVQNDKDLYEKLNDLHGRIYDVYYLEKQGEQKPVDSYCQKNCRGFQETGKCFADGECKAKREAESNDKNEPNFHEGDWVVFDNGNVEHITSVGTHGYTFDDGDYLLHDKCDKIAHLWSIQDAKDGDVLACCDNKPFIFKGFFGLNFPNCLEAYCGITLENQFRHCNSKTFWTNQDVKPATKKQRDTLEKAMIDAGYVFDFEKKELKKLGQPEVTKTSDQEEMAEIPFGAKDSELQEATYYIPKGFYAEIDDDKIVIKKGEKHNAWGEENERIRKLLIHLIKTVYNNTSYLTYAAHKGLIAWLEKLDDNIEL